jgi:KaiC
LNVIKLRGAQFRDGYHDYDILRGGLRVFPRLVAGEHRATHDRSRFVSGIPALDRLLGGGLNRGTSTLVIGPAGSGKSSIAGAFLIAAAKRGEHAASYVFEEARDTFLDRMSTIGMDVQNHHAQEWVRGDVHRNGTARGRLSPLQAIYRWFVPAGLRLIEHVALALESEQRPNP